MDAIHLGKRQGLSYLPPDSSKVESREEVKLVQVDSRLKAAWIFCFYDMIELDQQTIKRGQGLSFSLEGFHRLHPTAT